MANTNGNSYTFIYAAVLTVISAVLLAVSSEGLKPAQDANILLEKKMNVLNAVRFVSHDKKEIESTYEKYIQALVINSKGEEVKDVKAFNIVMKDEGKKTKEERNLPLYVYTGDDAKKYYIVPLYGAGLWGPVWGYISIDGSDFNTVYGSYFDHKGETPGLGAEISTEEFQSRFIGKKILEKNGFVSVRVLKKGSPFEMENSADHRVDGISGGTITSKGVDNMLMEWIGQYVPYFEKVKGNVQAASENIVSDSLNTSDNNILSKQNL